MEALIFILSGLIFLAFIVLSLRQALHTGFMVYTLSRLGKDLQREQNKLIKEMLGEL